MDTFTDTEMIKLAALASAFVVGLCVCGYVVIKDSVDLRRRRKARRLMYEDEVRRELARKKAQMQSEQQHQDDNLQSMA